MKYPQLVSMPSAVSDWLEEQLEARGIDAVVYTRYILSLLHSDAVDVIYSDEDLHFSHLKKEVRRSGGGGGRKRIRHSSEWRHAPADAEQLKRSAAVKCLMSASEQTYGIESLIDELCEKLKEIKSEVVAHTATETLSKSNLELQPVSPQELAKQYYAAFPPLNRNTDNNTNSPTKLILPKWIQSPSINNKKRNHLRKHSSRIIEQHHQQEHNNIIMRGRSYNNKQRFTTNTATGYFSNRGRKVDDSNKILSEGIMDKSDFYNHMFNNNNNKMETTNNFWAQQSNIKSSLNMLANTSSDDNQCFDVNNMIEWNIDDETNMYEDLPVDIKELLNDDDDDDVNDNMPLSSQHDDDTAVEMMNIANMRDTGKRDFLQCGTNIISSIWSNEATSFLNNSSELIFDLKSFDDNDNNWTIVDNSSNIIIDDNEMNESMFMMNDDNHSGETVGAPPTPFSHSFNNLPTGNWNYFANNSGNKREKWSTDTNCSSHTQELISQLTMSLLKLNHNNEFSPFVQILPKALANNNRTFNQFTQSTYSDDLLLTQPNDNTLIKQIDDVDDENEDDLLTSACTHFRPINEKITKAHLKPREYADGATFTISNSLDKVSYKRSDSGSLLVENDYGICKKYLEYKLVNDKSKKGKNKTTATTGTGLSLKFKVCQNDKASQTDDEDDNDNYCNQNDNEIIKSSVDLVVATDEINDGNNNNELMDQQQLQNIDEKKQQSVVNIIDSIINYCKCPSELKDMAMTMDYSSSSSTADDDCLIHPMIRSDSGGMLMLNEIVWKQNRCCTNSMWNTDWFMRNIDSYDTEWNNNEMLRNIWNGGGEVCSKCLNRNEINRSASPPQSSATTAPSSLQYTTQLRDDISQDGDQLLLDLNSMQKNYMEQQLLQMTDEFSCDFLLTDVIERKRRHSFTANMENPSTDHHHHHRGSFSFASRLEEDCLQIQMSTVPTLRSVTL